MKENIPSPGIAKTNMVELLLRGCTLSRCKVIAKQQFPELLSYINWLLTGEGTTQITQDYYGWMKERLEQKMKVIDSKTWLIQSPGFHCRCRKLAFC